MVVDAKILIVEDEGITALEIQNKVESWGYDVVDVVSSGEDAVKIAMERKPNLILMDVVLKEKLTGIEAAKIIKKTQDVPVIYLTAYGDEKTLQKAKLTIPQAYIIKPFEENELKFAVEMALFKHEMETKLKRSEEKYRTLAENARDIIFIMDVDDRVTYVNNFALKLLGLKPEEILGKSIKNFLPMDVSDKQRSELDKKVQKNTSIRIENKILFPENEMWLDTQLIPLKDKNCKTYGVMGISRDITHRRTIEDALRKSEEKYRAMVENISDVIFMVDKKGKITYISPTIEKITSYKQAEIVGSMLSTFVHPEDLEGLMDSIIKGFLSHERSPQEFRIFDKDGSLKYLRTSGQTIIKDGKVMGVTGVFSDITKSKMMEAALKDSEQRLKAVLYGSPIPAFVIDKNHKVLYWNKALEKSSKISADELIGTYEHWKAFYPEKRPCMADILVDGDIKSFSEWYNGDCTASDSVEDAYQSIDFFPNLGKNGKWLHFTAAAIKDSQGNIFGAIETLEDVTEQKRAQNSLKESEVRFRSVVESSTDAIIIGDQSMNILSWNKGAHEIFGYTEMEVIGQHITKIIPKNHGESHYKIEGNTIAILEKPTEMLGLKKDGTHFPMEILLTSWSMDGESFYTAFIRDITKRKLVESKIKSSLNEKEVLLKEIHHRVKNNMQIISSLISLQSDYADNEDTIKMFEDSKNRIRSMALIHEKLYQSEDISLIDFPDYIESLAGRLLEVYGVAGRGINLRINAEDIFLSIDAAIPCGLIINELVSNSIKHAFPDGRLGQITINMDRKAGEYVLTVADDGIGFPEDIDYKNTESLGLQIVQTLTSQLMGKIELYLNGGTRFEIIFNE